VTGKVPELWNPVTGERRALPEYSTQGERTTVPLRFEAEQSFFVVFREAAGRTPAAGGRNFVATTPVQDLAGPWKVAFDPKWGGPKEPVAFAQLTDWSKHPEPGIKYYSGTATYACGFEISDLRSEMHLDLGKVEVLAAVRLNGRDLGTVWCAPWRVDISSAVKPGANELKITVANLWPNRLIGDAALPAEKRLSWTTRNPFKPTSPLHPSGLLGPVRLLAGEHRVLRGPE
jgi:hypothetical protein